MRIAAIVTSAFAQLVNNNSLNNTLQYVTEQVVDDPRCFNCLLGDNPCLNWAECSQSSGKCICPAGFISDDCSKVGKGFAVISTLLLLTTTTCQFVACGSPANKNRPGRNGEEPCTCDDGWGGINCNGNLTNPSAHL